MDRSLRRKRCRANVRPAPFALTPELVGRVLALSEGHSRRVVQVPVLPIKLVDRPRRSEDPRLAKANDDAASEAAGNAVNLGGGMPEQAAHAPAAASVPAPVLIDREQMVAAVCRRPAIKNPERAAALRGGNPSRLETIRRIAEKLAARRAEDAE